MCVMAVQCMLGRCTVWYGGVLYVMYCVLWRCNVCYGGVMCVMAVI